MSDLEYAAARAVMDAMINQRIERLQADLSAALAQLDTAHEAAHKRSHLATEHDFVNAAREADLKEAA